MSGHSRINEKKVPLWLIALILVFFYGGATLAVASGSISEFVSSNSDNNPFTSIEVYETFIRVIAVCSLVLISFVQALFYRLLLVSLLKTERFSPVRSWFALLFGNVPFIITAYILLIPLFNADVSQLTELSFRIPFSVLSTVIYSLIVNKWVNFSLATGILFVCISSSINILLLLLGASLV